MKKRSSQVIPFLLIAAFLLLAFLIDRSKIFGENRSKDNISSTISLSPTPKQSEKKSPQKKIPIKLRSNLTELTLEELEKYDGKYDRKGYIAVYGKIYDVSNSKDWRHGMHISGRYFAGKDNSNEFKLNPNDSTFLEKLPIIGYIVDKNN